MFDAAMLRATPDNLLQPTLHVRGDGTLVYYFTYVHAMAACFVMACITNHSMRASVRCGLKQHHVWHALLPFLSGCLQRLVLHTGSTPLLQLADWYTGDI